MTPPSDEAPEVGFYSFEPCDLREPFVDRRRAQVTFDYTPMWITLGWRKATQSTPGAVRRLSDKRRSGRGVWGEPLANIASPVAEVSLLGSGSKKVTMQREGLMASK
jgi:hypothetical protein